MKKLITLFAILCNLTICFAQGATLTKEETVNYINKKVQETEGHFLKVDFGEKLGVLTFYYYSSLFSLSSNKIIYYRNRGTYKEVPPGNRKWVAGHGYQTFFPCDFNKLDDEFSFAPENILSIEKMLDTLNENNPVGTIIIKISNNTGLFKRTGGSVTTKFTSGDFYGECTDFKNTSTSNSVNEIYLSYLKGDDSNFNKIKKALEYLRDLAKAEDDPFGN